MSRRGRAAVRNESAETQGYESCQHSETEVDRDEGKGDELRPKRGK